MQPSDLSRLHTVSDPRVHPDARRVAFVVSRPDLDDDAYVRAIHLWDPERGQQQLTHGPRDRTPRWSPDGTLLAFLRTGPADGDHAQLAVLPADGGEARVLTDLPLGVTDLAWAPDSTRLVVVGVEWVGDLGDLDDDERARRPRRITRIPYRTDSDGWIHDRRSHLWVVDVDVDGDAEPRCITPGDFDESTPAVRPDGRTVVFRSQRGVDRETDPGVEIYEVPLEGGGATQVLASGLWSRPVCLDDGGLLVVGLRDTFEWPAPPRLFRVDRSGDLVDLARDLDRDVADERVVVTDDGYLAMVADRGRTHVYRFGDAGPPERVVGGDREVTGVSASPDGATVAFTATTSTDPGELWRAVDGHEQVCTTVNAGLRTDGGLITAEHTTFVRDGAEIDAWVLLPGDVATQAPLLLNIHGGPTAQYGFGFHDEFQIYAAAGYAVIGINPRGSSGRGREWARAVVGVWTSVDSADTCDLEAAVDMVLDRYPTVAHDRVGIMGGSYGGFATARLLARTDRFGSAVVERGLLNWVSFGGTSDIGTFFDRMFLQQTLPDGAGALWDASPVAVADRITTPTLVIHSDRDWRCPVEQAEQLFAMLRRRGVEAELLRFPDEGHELSRSGSPKHRVERFRAILEWHARHLGQAD